MRKLSVFLLAATANALLCTPGVRHSPRTANFSPVMQNSESDSDAAALSAQRELSTALSKARRNSESLPDLPGGAAAVAYSPAIVAYTLWLSITATLMITEFLSAAAAVPGPVSSLASPEMVLHGLIWGVPGAALVKELESWRCKVSAAEISPTVSNTVVLGLLPLAAIIERLRGERALPVVREAPFLTAATLVGGAAASSAVVNGLLQSSYAAILRELFDAGAAPFCGLAAAATPAAAAMTTAAALAMADGAVDRALRPLARAREDAEAAAVADLRRRAPRLYQLGMPPDAARRMSRALEEEAGAWEWRRAEERRRADVARVLRAAVVSTVYAASGGSLMAPVLASLGVLGARGERVKRE